MSALISASICLFDQAGFHIFCICVVSLSHKHLSYFAAEMSHMHTSALPSSLYRDGRFTADAEQKTGWMLARLRKISMCNPYRRLLVKKN